MPSVTIGTNGKINFEAKRDRWNGYDNNKFTQVINEWNDINEEQKKRQQQEVQDRLLKKQKNKKDDSFDNSDSSSEGDPDLEKEGASKSLVDDDPRKRTITKNLRIREDTAKYLRNHDPNSAAYSGKSRTMNENPNPDKASNLTTF